MTFLSKYWLLTAHPSLPPFILFIYEVNKIIIILLIIDRRNCLAEVSVRSMVHDDDDQREW